MLLTRFQISSFAVFIFKSCSTTARNKSTRMRKISRKAARGFIRIVFILANFFFYFFSSFLYCVRSTGLRMMLMSRSTEKYTVSIRTHKKLAFLRGNVGLLSTFCVVYFTMNEHRSLVLAFASPSILSFNFSLSRSPHELKIHLWKVFYSWTIPNLFYALRVVR